MVERAPDADALLASLDLRVWEELARAVQHTGHGWRTPVLATVDASGQPQARTVVLRGCSLADGTLDVFTDARSPKVGELQAQPRASLVFWCPALQWQLRVQAMAHVHRDGPLQAAAWDTVRGRRSASDYLSAQAPGTPLATSAATFAATFAATSANAAAASPAPFALIRLTALQLDWLALSPNGHQRAIHRLSPPPGSADQASRNGWQWVQA